MVHSGPTLVCSRTESKLKEEAFATRTVQRDLEDECSGSLLWEVLKVSIDESKISITVK